MTTITLQTISAFSISELKAFAATNNIQIEGDKRKKATWIEAITDFLVECGEMEEVANQADIANGVVGELARLLVEDITLEELEASQESLLDYQAHYETILNATTVKSTVSSTKTPESVPVVDVVLSTSSTKIQAKNVQLSFNQTSSNITPMVMVLWTLAMIVVPAVVLVGRLANGAIKVFRKALPLIDQWLTTILQCLVNIVEWLFGSDYDLYSDSYLEIKHLLRRM